MVEPLPQDVERFMDSYLESVEQLEILRILGEDPSREWDAAGLAHLIQAAPDVVAGHLGALQKKGLITCTAKDAHLSCRHGAAAPDLEAKVARLLQLYKERPVTMINRIYARARQALKSFADAFKLRTED